MIDNDLKQWIIKNLISDNGHVNNKFLKFKKFNSKECNLIIKASNFLEDNCLLAERLYCIINNIKNVVVCLNNECSNKVSFRSYPAGYINKYCSPNCSSKDERIKNKIKETFMKKYGTESLFESDIIRKKIEKTNIKKFGCKRPFQSEKIRNKAKKTCIKNNGVDYPFKSKKIQDKIDHKSEEKLKKTQKAIKKTMFAKHGVLNVFQLEEVKNKIKKTCMEKYGVEYHSQHYVKDILYKIENKEWLINQQHDLKKSCTQIANELRTTPATILNKFKKFNIKVKNHFNSIYEKEIVEFLNTVNVIINNRTIIYPYELDIYLPDIKLAIEFNGLYWHSYNKKETPEEKRKHLTKTEMCEKHEIQLLHIFENEWLDPVKQEIWKSIINSKLDRNRKIYDNNCEIREITDNKLIKYYLNNNCLQGYVKSKLKLGLFYDDELVFLMILGCSKRHEWIIHRLCNKNGLNILGGPRMLFDYFIYNYKYKSIIINADRRYEGGKDYELLGFKTIGYSNPSCYYYKIKENILYNKTYKKQLENFDIKLSESENMFNNNYRRIWDCGQSRYCYGRINNVRVE